MLFQFLEPFGEKTAVRFLLRQCERLFYAMAAVLLGCGLRRAELASVTVQHLQQREEHAVFADLVGKGTHVRTVPVPFWVEAAVQKWLNTANIMSGPVFRAINKAGPIAGAGFSPKVIFGVAKKACVKCDLTGVAPQDLRRYAEVVPRGRWRT